jgi:cell division protein FtsQ
VKRPQGFDRPPAPRARQGGADAPAAAVSASPPPRVEADRVATEPIPIAAVATPTARRPDAPASPVDVRDAAATAVLDGLEASVDEAEPEPRPRDARSARRALAAAAWERRRYERQEVRRFTRRSRRRRITWAVVIGALVALVVVIGVGAYSPLMALREVRVEGAQRVPAAEVQAAFAEVIGTPLPLIDQSEVQEALEAFPLIETYTTETIPPGTLVVRIVERTPVGVIDTGSGLELVDAAGVVIERPAERPEGQPLIEVDGGIAGEGFRAVASVVRSLPADVRVQLTRATAETADDVRLELTGGARVVWGSAEDSAQKATVLARLMGAAPPDSVSFYDVSAPSSAVTG